MSKPLLAVIAPVTVIGFLYMHFEWLPAHSGPERAAAVTEIAEWTRTVGGHSLPDVRVGRVNVPDAAGVSAVDVTFHDFYFEHEGAGQRYSGRGRIDFTRVGPMFQPRWVITGVSLLDRKPPAVLQVSSTGAAN